MSSADPVTLYICSLNPVITTSFLHKTGVRKEKELVKCQELWDLWDSWVL
jgi:hypothetical protein